MMQPAQPILRKNPPGCGGANSVVRGSLPQPKMRAVLVVVADVFRKQTFQMAFIRGNDVIQQISSAAFKPNAPLHHSAKGFRRTFVPGSSSGIERRLEPPTRTWHRGRK
jgi:hypothetical protein